MGIKDTIFKHLLKSPEMQKYINIDDVLKDKTSEEIIQSLNNVKNKDMVQGVLRQSITDTDILEAFRDEMYGFRRLRGAGYLSDILPVDKFYLCRVGRALYYTSPLCKKIIDTPLVWYFSGGLKLTSSNKRLKACLEKFIKLYSKHLHDMLRVYVIDGELIVPTLFYTDKTVDFSYIDGLNIVTVNVNKKNPLHMDTIQYTKHASLNPSTGVMTSKQEELSLKIINPCSYDINDIISGTHGFYFKANNLPGHRGRSFIEQNIDWIYNYDEYLIDLVRQNRLAGGVMWDVTINGGSKDQVETRVKEIMNQPPPSGSVLVHNECETWETKGLQLNRAGTKIDSQILLNHIATGSGYDGEWIGVETNESNYFQTTKYFEYIFNIYNEVILTLAKCFIRSHKAAGYLPKSVDEDDIQILNASQNILLMKQASITVSQLTNAMKTATEHNWVSGETASKVVHQALNIFDYEYDGRKAISYQEFLNLLNTMISAHNSGMVDDKTIEETINTYLNQSDFLLTGSIRVNPSGMAPANSSNLQGEKVDV